MQPRHVSLPQALCRFLHWPDYTALALGIYIAGTPDIIQMTVLSIIWLANGSLPISSIS